MLRRTHSVIFGPNSYAKPIANSSHPSTRTYSEVGRQRSAVETRSPFFLPRGRRIHAIGLVRLQSLASMEQTKAWGNTKALESVEWHDQVAVARLNASLMERTWSSRQSPTDTIQTPDLLCPLILIGSTLLTRGNHRFELDRYKMTLLV